MIRRIHIANEASYDPSGQTLSDLSQINFVYGANATGKTTISRVIHDESVFPDCSIDWEGGAALETLVYNRDFVERNFNQPDELKGIFTLGEKDKDTLDKITAAKTQLDDIATSIASLTKTLAGEDGDGGKNAELTELDQEFEEKCWQSLKQKYDDKLQGAFSGVRGKKRESGQSGLAGQVWTLVERVDFVDGDGLVIRAWTN